jgi:hypothetical protein
MLTVTATTATWPFEILKINYPSFVANRKYQVYLNFAETITSHGDRVNSWVNVNPAGLPDPRLVHGTVTATEINLPVSAATNITFNNTGATSSSNFIVSNDHAAATLRYFAPSVVSANISPDFAVVTNTSLPLSTREAALEQTTLLAGSGQYIIPSHLIFSDSRSAPVINSTSSLQVSAALRQFQTRYFGSYAQDQGALDASQYRIPFVDYVNTNIPWNVSSLSSAQVSALRCAVRTPVIYRHIANTILSDTVDGESTYDDNLFAGLDIEASAEIKRGSLLLQFGYKDPNITAARKTQSIIADNKRSAAKNLTTVSVPSSYTFIRDDHRVAYVRDVPNHSIAGNATLSSRAPLIGRAGVTNEMIVNSAVSFVDYTTGEISITLDSAYAYTFDGSALRSSYTNRSFTEYGGYPQYTRLNTSNIDQPNSIFAQISTVGNSMNATFDVSVLDLNTVVNLTDYPLFGSKTVTSTASAVNGAAITYNAITALGAVSAIQFNIGNNIPPWLFTYTTFISSSASTSLSAFINGMDLTFNILSANTTINLNSAIIEPFIVSNYGTTFYQFSARDTEYGYFQLEVPQAIGEYNGITNTPELSVYLLNPNNTVSSAYPISINALDINMPYKVKSFKDVRTVALSTLQENIKNDTTPLTLKNVSFYYGDNVVESTNANLVSLQLYAIKNAIINTSQDNSLSLIGAAQTFINKMYKFVNECINPSNKLISDLALIEEELQYKFNTCGNIYKSFYEAFSSICRNYVSNAASNNANNTITPITTELCTAIAATLGNLAAQNGPGVQFSLASDLVSIKSLIEAVDTNSYNFIVDTLTESFIIATWPGAYNVSSILKQNEITYDSGQFSVIKKILSLRLERAFGYYNSGLIAARNAGRITATEYNNFLQYFAVSDFATFNKNMLALKASIGYTSLVAAKINKQYTANSNKNIAYYIFKAEMEINQLFNYLYAISVFDRDTLFSDLYSTLNLEEYGVENIVVGFVNKNVLINKTTNAEVFASNNLAEINNLDNTYYTSPLVPLSSRFCIVSPVSGFYTASYNLNMITGTVGSTYIDLDQPQVGVQTYIHKNCKLNKKINPYSKSDFILNKAQVRSGVAVTFSKPFSGDDAVTVNAIIPPGLIPASKRTEATVMWRVSALDTDKNYLKASILREIASGNTITTDFVGPLATAFTSGTNFLFASARMETPTTNIFTLSTVSNDTNVLFGQSTYSNMAATLAYIGVNPITVSVSVSSNYLSAYSSPYITNNTITGQAVYVPDLGEIKTFNTFDTTKTSAYPTNVITSNLSVVSADFTSNDNEILLRNYFIKNNRIYNPPLFESAMFNIESLYGSTRLFKLSSENAAEQEIPINSLGKNAPYYRVKTIMPTVLDTFTPTKDKLFINLYNTPPSVKSPNKLDFVVPFFQHTSNLYAKFNITATTVSGSSALNTSRSTIGSNTNTDLIVALSAAASPYSISFVPISSQYATYSWVVSSIPTSAYSINNDTNALTISSSRLSSIANNLGVIRLSTLFTYLDGVSEATLVSDPLFIYVSNQSISSFAASAWTINRFNTSGLSAVNTSAAVTVNTNLSTIGDGHVETLALKTYGSPFESYIWQVGNSNPLVTNTNTLTATIAGTAGDSLAVSVTGFNLIYSKNSHLNALSSQYDEDKVLIVNPSYSAAKLVENDYYSVTTENSAITSTVFKNLDFRILNTPTISSGLNTSVYYFNSAIDIQYGVRSFVTNTVGERLLSAKMTVGGNIRNVDTNEIKAIPVATFTTLSGLSSNAVTLATIRDLDLYGCALISLTSNNVTYVGVSNAPGVLKTTDSVETFRLTAIKLPEINLFWDETHYQVGDKLIIKNNGDPKTCFSRDIGFETLSVKFNNQLQIVPASASQIVFNNLNDNGIYSIEVSARTLSALSASYPLISTNFVNAITVVDKFDVFNKDARILNEQLELPYTADQIYIAPNEFAVANNINDALKKLYSNYTYLKNKAKFNDTKLPVSFNKWLGATADSINKWRYIDSSNWYNIANTVFSKEFKQILAIKVAKDKLIVADRLATNTDRISVYNFDLLSQSISTRLNVIGEDLFVEIAAIDTDSAGNLYVIDKGANAIYQYKVNYNSAGDLVFTKKISGLGNASRPYRFNTPVDIHISRNDRIYIVDQKNDTIKVYNNKLGYLFNISYKDWVLQNDIISVSTDASENVYVLRKTGAIYVFNSAGKFVTVFNNINNPFNGTPVKILCNKIDDGITYIVYETHISKITNSGHYLGYFRPLHHPYINKLTAVTQYGRNIIVADQSVIYNNVDFISLKSIINDFDSVEWKEEDILIDDAELVQDWVYNVAFGRIKDNLELYSKNIHSKYVFTVNVDGEVLSNLIPMPTNELPTLDFTQSVIGQNELVFADVINRVIKQIYQNQQAILESIESTIKTNLCADNWCWSWSSLGSVDPIKKNCLVNPITFMELRSNSPGIGGRTWTQIANTNTCCEILSS